MNLIKILLLSILFVFLPIKRMNSQNNTEGVATYEFRYNLSKKQARKMKKSFRKINLENLLKNPINWQFKLKFKENIGVFYLDSLIDHENENTSSILLTGVGRKEMYLNADENTVCHNYTTPKREQIIVKDNLKPTNWNISNETKIINGYKVKKATAYYQVNNAQLPVRNEKVTAWFAPAIPSSLGPLIFGNLPGLILELDFKGNRFSYVLTNIHFDKNVEIPEIKGEREISKEYYDKTYTFITY